jgi:hypothetical protein
LTKELLVDLSFSATAAWIAAAIVEIRAALAGAYVPQIAPFAVAPPVAP